MRKTITVTAEAHSLLVAIQADKGYKSLTETIVKSLADPQDRQILVLSTIYKELKSITMLNDQVKDLVNQLIPPPLKEAELMLKHIANNDLDNLYEAFPELFDYYDAIEDDTVPFQIVKQSIKDNDLTPFTEDQRKHGIFIKGYKAKGKAEAEEYISYDS